MAETDGNNSLEINLDRVCRTCLREGEQMRSMFLSENNLNDVCITKMVTSCTQLKVLEDDGLPIHICYNCLNTLTNAFSFKLQAEKVDAKLRDYIAQKKCSPSLIIEDSIKEEEEKDFTHGDNNIVVKTENQNENFEYQMKNSYNESPNNTADDQSDDSDDFKPLKDLKVIASKKLKDTDDEDFPKKLDNHKQQRYRTDIRRTLTCKLCDKTFKYVNCLKKHLQNHISFEPFATVDLKSKTALLGNHEKLSGTDPQTLSDDYIIKLIIEDIKAGKFDQYMGEAKTDDNRTPPMLIVPEVHVPVKDPADKKTKMITIKSKIKRGIKKIRKHKFHKCSICDRMFSRSNHLIRHMSTHNYNYPDKCEICNKVFPNKEMLSRHNRIQCENTIKPYRCGTCDMKFPDEISFNDHTTKRHKGDSVSANFVRLEDIIAEKFEQYISELKVDNTQTFNPAYDGPTKMYACDICDMKFTEVTNFQEHALEQHSDQTVTFTIIDLENIKTEKTDSYTSEADNNGINSDAMDEDSNGFNESISQEKKVYILKKTIKRGIKKIRKHKLHVCSVCERTFTRSNHLIRHMSIHNYNYPDKCEICLKVFPNKEMLNKHSLMRCENTSKTYRCSTCDIKFSNDKEFTEHIMTRHKGESVSVNFIDPLCQKKEKTFPCEHCDKSFYRKDHLDKHIKIHAHRERIFECEICQRKFKEKENLISHSFVHELKKGLDSKYHCIYCDHSFSNTSNLIVHMRRHTGEKPFKCDICEKGFPRSSDLRCHRRTHTGEKPCLCTICGKGFSRSNKLARHMRVHTGVRPYKCTFCERAFTQSNDLTLHIRRHTGDRPYVCDICGDRFINGTALHTHRRQQGHYIRVIEQTPPYAVNPLNNLEESSDANLAAQVEVSIKAED